MLRISKTKNQHFIPKFLIKNFARCVNPHLKKKKQKFKTNFFTVDTPTESKNINNIASDDYFYEWEVKGEVEIEEVLSSYENRYASTLNLALDRQEIQKSQCQPISNFLFNLTWRTENNRVLLREFMKRGFEKAAQETLGDHLEMEKILTKGMNDEIARQPIKLDRNQKAKIMSIGKPYLDAEIRKEMDKFIEGELQTHMGRLTSETQSKLVTHNDISAHAIMSQVTWGIFESTSDLLLGDVGPIAFDMSADSWGPLFWMLIHNNVDLILLPVSPHRYLLGTPTNQNLNAFSGGLDADAINTLQAKQSYGFFVCDNLEVGNDYRALIGETHSMYREKWDYDSLCF